MESFGDGGPKVRTGSCALGSRIDKRSSEGIRKTGRGEKWFTTFSQRTSRVLCRHGGAREIEGFFVGKSRLRAQCALAGGALWSRLL
jgi:hypothetical protein